MDLLFYGLRRFLYGMIAGAALMLLILWCERG